MDVQTNYRCNFHFLKITLTHTLISDNEKLNILTYKLDLYLTIGLFTVDITIKTENQIHFTFVHSKKNWGAGWTLPSGPTKSLRNVSTAS